MKVVRPSNSLGGLIISCLIIYLNLYNMQFNFRNLLVAGAAIFTLTACNNSDNDVFKAEESNLKVQIKLPSANPLSRALVDEAKETDFLAKHIYAYVLKGNKEIAKAEAKITDKVNVTAKFDKIILDGSETVLVKVNGKEDSKMNIKIEDIQPTEEAGKLQNIVYAGNEKLTNSEIKDGIKNYNVTMDVNSIAARVEVMGEAKFNKELVASMKVSMVAPLRVKAEYNNPAIKENKKGDKMYTTLENGITEGKVVANHLFAGDVPSITIGFDIVKYGYYTIDKSIITIDKKFVYKLEKGKYGTIADNAEAANAKEFIEYRVNEDKSLTKLGKITSSIVKQNSKTEYFTMRNFEGAEKYKGGHIYLIDLEKNLTWNEGEGVVKDEYNPEYNEGTDTPKVQEESTINVAATVKEWTKSNTNVSIN